MASMTPLERLHANLATARREAEREGSDRHSNPGRALRDLRRQSQAGSDAHRLEQAIVVAATAAGVAWIYAAYLAGNVPMTATARKLPPQRNIELDVILDAVGLPAELDPSLAALAPR